MLFIFFVFRLLIVIGRSVQGVVEFLPSFCYILIQQGSYVLFSF